MKIKADLADVTITLGNNGITLNIANNSGGHAGDLRIGKASGEWMPGRTRTGNGHKFTIEDLLKAIETTFPK